MGGCAQALCRRDTTLYKVGEYPQVPGGLRGPRMNKFPMETGSWLPSWYILNWQI